MNEYQEQMIYDEGRRRGFQDGYTACREDLAENVMERIQEDGTLVVTISDATKVTRVLVQDHMANGDLYYNDRPKGEWLPIIEANEFGEPYQAGIYCSECGERLCCEANFCPNCGADMRGEDNE